MIKPDYALTPVALRPAIVRMFEASAEKLFLLQRRWEPQNGTPVYTVGGRYTSRGWTEWTQGFQFGSALLQFAATGETTALEYGREGTRRHMAGHLTHIGVHDHGFNNVSTYGTLLGLSATAQLKLNPGEIEALKLALKVSGAVQAARWTALPDSLGYIYSFNGPHSLFADTLRSLRSLALSHALGHVLMGERDRRVSLLERLLQHAETTARYAVYYGDGRDAYDVRGRVAHESIFNVNDGSYRCPNSQQGYSPFSTWTRGLAWILLGYAEQLEFLSTLRGEELQPYGGLDSVLAKFLKPALATADFFIANTPIDGIAYWDTGAPGLAKLPGCLELAADPFNDHEPVDSSASCIAAQGFLRLGRFLQSIGRSEEGAVHFATGLTIARTLLSERYLAAAPEHEGLLLHAVYHRPNGWDHIPPGRRVPCGESCLWGDYHLRELGLLILRLAEGRYYTFFDGLSKGA